MNSDLSIEMAESALAIGDNNNKRYPWDFVYTSTVAGTQVQTISNAEKGKQISRTQWLIQIACYQSESCGRSLKFHPLQQLYVHICLMREPTRFASTCKAIEISCWKDHHLTAAVTYQHIKGEKKRIYDYTGTHHYIH